jgi:lysozyme family protein
LLGIEGDYSDHPADSGGKTRWGVTEAVARRHGYVGPMRDYPIEDALRVYRLDYWDLMGLDDVAEASEPIAGEMFDTGVNAGTGVAVEFLQRSLNVLNRQGGDYGDVEVDGSMGPQTLAALHAYLHIRKRDGGETVLMRALNCLQGARYIELAERRAKDEAFVHGWLRHRVIV